jgi:hypothetical protein
MIKQIRNLTGMQPEIFLSMFHKNIELVWKSSQPYIRELEPKLLAAF